MACLEMQPEHPESEREEGEIVDEIDDQLSDISSEEEFLMRQRLAILENYNDVLERKKAKRSSIIESSQPNQSMWPVVAPIKICSKPQINQKIRRNNKYTTRLKKEKHPKIVDPPKNYRKKRSKKSLNIKIHSELSESSDSNDEEYKNKRKKFADAVTLNKSKSDGTSLKDRLAKMLYSSKTKNQQESFIIHSSIIVAGQSSISEKLSNEDNVICTENKNDNNDLQDHNKELVNDLIEISTDDDVRILTPVIPPCDALDSLVTETKDEINNADDVGSSDEDLESLRQHALKTKTAKVNVLPIDMPNVVENKTGTDDEDSDTADLRLICLRSSLLKRAIELKKKQKLQKRLSQSSVVDDDTVNKYKDFDVDNNNESHTDVENVDMDIGSDVDEKLKICVDRNTTKCKNNGNTKLNSKENKQDEIEEDEDLLRARLLTSLSKNLPNLIDFKPIESPIIDTDIITYPKIEPIKAANVPEKKKFIIKLGDSDSEAEHEATKNLTKMHMKLAEQTEFQQKLDLFLKSTRMQVEQSTVPEIVQPQCKTNSIQKFIPKKMQHLPTSEQIEYKKLVKRMVELEKIKQARQCKSIPEKDTLKPRNVSLNVADSSNKRLEERIASSRKMIAEESAKMLKLKEEGTKLSQRYKIVSTELRNISTAITLNKKQQRVVQNSLSKIRNQHQMLLKSSSNVKHSDTNTLLNVLQSTALRKEQKENDPSIKDHNNHSLLKNVKVTVANNLNTETNNHLNTTRLSIELDVASNKKLVKVPKTNNERLINIQETENICNKSNKECDIAKDYISPLDAIKRTDWKEDPNAFLCRFDVGGTCRDIDCKFLHLNTPTTTQL